MPQAALFAFTVSVPLLNGLGYVGLAGCPSPVSLVFSAIFLGFSLKEVQKGANERWRGRQDEFSRKKAQEAQREEAQGAALEAGSQSTEARGQGQRAEGGATDSRSCRATEAEEWEAKSRATDAQSYGAIEAGDRGSNPKLKTQPQKLSPARLATDILITAVLASLVAQIWRHHDAAGIWTKFYGQPVFGFGDPFYFITSAFLWLQGLFFFRMLIEMGEEQRAKRSEYGGWGKEPRAGSEGARDKGEEQDALSKERSAGGEAVAAWVRPVFAVYGATLVIFYLLQFCLHVPEPNITWFFEPQPFPVSVHFSPYEDIHSLGSIAIAIFAYAVASWQRKSWPKTLLAGIFVVALLALVVASWSRATWLTGALVLLLVAWIRLPMKWTAMLVTMGVIAAVILNVNTDRTSWNRNPYLRRLIKLVRFEKLSSKDPSRLYLYEKAVGMIQDQPITGHGVGSFYLTSVRFARPGDPYADIPNFAHNFLLQMAAELGVPSAALFLALILFTLWQGYRKSGARRKFQVPSPKFQDHGVGNLEAGGERWTAEGEGHDGRTVRRSNGQDSAILGVTMALVAYLITQMTANALNIYVSNQFFFWFLMAAVLCANPKSEVESLKSKVEI
jgi:O-antigen ligase